MQMSPKKRQLWRKKPRYQRRTVSAKNLGFGVGFGYRNNTNGWEISTGHKAVAVFCSKEANCSLASHWPCITDHMIWAQWPNEGRWALKLHSSICMLKPTVQIACQPNVQDTSPKHLSPKWFAAQTSADHRTHVSFTVTRRLSTKLFGRQMF